MPLSRNSNGQRLSIKETVLFALFGALMFASRQILAVLPNIHLLGCLIVVFTRVFRKKALYIIYVFVFLEGIFAGFATWWVPYLYIWTVLWGAVMLLPEELPKKAEPWILMTVSGLHGLLYGVLYAPCQALFFGLSWKALLAWVAAGFPFDAIHGVSNFLVTSLAVPLIRVIKKAQANY